MKKLILLFILNVNAYALYSQSVVIADPAVSQMDLVNPDGIIPEFANYIAPGKVVQIKIPVFNLNQLNTIPPGSCRLTINLGKYFILDPAFILSGASLNNYFNWTSSVVSGDFVITGNLITPLPGDFVGTAIFNIKAGTVLATSEIICNFQTTNQNTTTTLVDEDLNNNIASLQYTVTTNPVVPVTFSRFSILKKDCLINLDFSAVNPVNVQQYEIEVSKDAINFSKIGELSAINRVAYHFNFTPTSNLATSQLFVRIKSVDLDGKFQFSETRIVSGICDEKENKLLLFPNPAAAETNEIFVKRTAGIFKGKYNISLLDATGKLLKKEQFHLNTVSQFSYKINDLSKGQFILLIQNKDEGNLVTTMRFLHL